MFNFAKFFRRLLRSLGVISTPSPRPEPVDPVPTPEPVPEPPVVVPPTPEPVRNPTRAEVLDFRGHLGYLRDSANRVIWTPSLQALPPEIRAEWLRIYVEEGGTHVPVGPFEPGEIYPGAGFFNPDWQQDPASIRAFLDELRATRTKHGYGLIPVIFVDGGGSHPASRLHITMPTIAEAIKGIEPHVIVLPTGWEPHDWTAREQWDAIQLWMNKYQNGSILAWHGWPGRSNGASNDPFNQHNTDPWLADRDPETGAAYGDGSKFWQTTPFDMFLYQIEPPRRMADANCGIIAAPGKGVYPEGCWLDGLLHAMCRVGGAGRVDGTGAIIGPAWANKVFVLFETTTYWEFRGLAEPGTTQRVNDRAYELAGHYNIKMGFGTGLPAALKS